MPEDNWADQAKSYFLYQSQRGSGVEVMLKRTKTNSRVNTSMARWIMALEGISHNWTGPYKDLFSDVFETIQEQYMNVEAYARKQAIELAGAIAKANAIPGPAEMPAKRAGGLLGLFK